MSNGRKEAGRWADGDKRARRETVERVLLYHASAIAGGVAQPDLRDDLEQSLSTSEDHLVLSREAQASVDFVLWLMHPIAAERAEVRCG